MRSGDNEVVQIVITRRGPDAFRVVTFSKAECLGGKILDTKATDKFVAKTIKKLKALPGLD